MNRKITCGGLRAIPAACEGLECRVMLSNPPLPQGQPILPPYAIRIGYLIPSDRTSETNGVSRLQTAIRLYQKWYREQMQRFGFGPKTFAYEAMGDGVTPLVHVVKLPHNAAYYRADDDGNNQNTIYSRVISDAPSAGIPVFSPNQIWALVVEDHLELPGGQVTGAVSLGASFGSGSDGGVGLVGSDMLAMLDQSYLTNDQAYGGKTVPDIGGTPLGQGLSFPAYEGDTFSSVSSSRFGALLHEMSHGLGLDHDFRNDQNFEGDLMGNGLRGFRGALFPDRYPTDATRLGFGDAMALNYSRYFNAGRQYTDDTKPNVTDLTSGSVHPSGGDVHISFKAADSAGVRVALLRLDGNNVGEMQLSSTSQTAAFDTPYYTPGQANHYQISVYDASGNRTDAETTITPDSGFNRAPQVNVQVLPEAAKAGQAVTLDAGDTTDQDDSLSSLQVQWDFNGDGVFDTPLSTSKTLTKAFPFAGMRLIRARVVDPSGASSLSEPIALRVTKADGTNDTAAPTAKASAASVTLGGGTSCNFTVTYHDDQAVKPSTFDSGDIRVTGPHGFSQAATFVQASASTDGATRTATYGIVPPGNGWDPADNGTYTIVLRAGQVTDTSYNATAGGNIGSFTVRSPALPTAKISLAPVHRGTSTYLFNVTYAATPGIRATGLGIGDIVVTGPSNFSQLASLFAVTPAGNGTPRTATYRITPPGGTWDATTDGVYRFTLRPLRVRDMLGNYAASKTLGSLVVNL